MTGRLALAYYPADAGDSVKPAYYRGFGRRVQAGEGQGEIESAQGRGDGTVFPESAPGRRPGNRRGCALERVSKVGAAAVGKVLDKPAHQLANGQAVLVGGL